MSHRRLLSPIGLLAPLISSYLIMISGLYTEANLIGAGLLLRHQLRVLIFEMLVTLYSLELPLRTYKSLVWVAISSGSLAMLQTGLDKKRRHRKF
jgi:predicted membrane metal-binding protein